MKKQRLKLNTIACLLSADNSTIFSAVHTAVAIIKYFFAKLQQDWPEAITTLSINRLDNFARI